MSSSTLTPDRPPKRASKRLSRTQLARFLKCSEGVLSYRVKQGQLPPPDADGLYDRDAALRAFQAKPLHYTARRSKPATVRARPGRGPSRSRSGAPDSEHLDPDTRFRVAKAQQEELKLAKMRHESVDLHEAQRRAFRIIRTWRDIEDASVSREAPLIAARLGVDEGTLWRELKQFMSAVQSACADLDVPKALAEGIVEEEGDEDGDETETPEHDETEGDRPHDGHGPRSTTTPQRRPAPRRRRRHARRDQARSRAR
jgi:hypothetical protein